jgi:hypothetical protein
MQLAGLHSAFCWCWCWCCGGCFTQLLRISSWLQLASRVVVCHVNSRCIKICIDLRRVNIRVDLRRRELMQILIRYARRSSAK